MSYNIVNSTKITQEDLLKIIELSLGKDIFDKGGNCTCFLVNFKGEEYAVLRTFNIECYYFDRQASKEECDEIIESGNLNLKRAMEKTIAHESHKAVPIVGFIYDKDTIIRCDNQNSCAYASGYIIQKKAKGQKLFKGLPSYPFTDEQKYKEGCFYWAKEYAKIPPQHFAEFLVNAEMILRDLAIDPSKPGNFFYDKHEGFSFIDLGALSRQKFTRAQVVHYISVQFRDRIKQYCLSFDDAEKQREYENNMYCIYQNMAYGFITAGLSIEECAEVFEKIGIDRHIIEECENGNV